MQFIDISYQLQITLYSLFFGVGAGAAYDIVKIIRMLFGVIYTDEKKLPLLSRLPAKKPRIGRFFSRGAEVILVNIADIVYAAFISVAFCVFLFASNNGRFRWYLFAAACVGFALYRVSIARIVIRISEYIVPAVKIIAGFALFVIWQPVCLVWKAASFIFLPAYAAIRRKLGIIKTEKIRKKLPSELFPRS